MAPCWHVQYITDLLGRGKKKTLKKWMKQTSHQQPSCQKQRVEDVTVCITYDTVCTHFHINRYEICQSTLSWQDWDDQRILVVPSINTHTHTYIQKNTQAATSSLPHLQIFFFPFHIYVLPFLDAYRTMTVAMATCIKRRVNVIKIWLPPFFKTSDWAGILEVLQDLDRLKYCQIQISAANLNSKQSSKMCFFSI